MERIYTLALTFLRGLSAAQALKCYRHYGSATAIFEDEAPEEPKLQQVRSAMPEAIARAEQEVEMCEKNGIQLLCLGDEAYPSRLRECVDSPLALFYRGTADLNARHVVSIVGTRKITAQGIDICQHLCQDLARMVPDLLVVSGLAYGVDINAHRQSLAAGVPTVGVLAHGLDTLYPSSHRQTAAQMVSNGGLLTEYVFGTSADKGNFVQRNRIVAGMADATIVVESAKKGGALITAEIAQDYNRDVFAYPGRVKDIYSEGCNNLIRDNRAALITSAEDMVLAMQWATKEGLNGEAVQQELFPTLTPDEQGIIDIMKNTESISISQISRLSGLSFSKLNALLLSLEMKGLLRALPGSIYRLIR